MNCIIYPDDSVQLEIADKWYWAKVELPAFNIPLRRRGNGDFAKLVKTRLIARVGREIYEIHEARVFPNQVGQEYRGGRPKGSRSRWNETREGVLWLRCSICSMKAPAKEAFHKQSYNPYGYTSSCKECTRAGRKRNRRKKILAREKEKKQTYDVSKSYG